MNQLKIYHDDHYVASCQYDTKHPEVGHTWYKLGDRHVFCLWHDCGFKIEEIDEKGCVVRFSLF